MIDGHSLNLWNGIVALTRALPEDAKVGDILEYNVKTFDEYNVDPLINRFYILVDAESVQKDGTGGKNVQPPGNKGGNAENLAMPEKEFIKIVGVTVSTKKVFCLLPIMVRVFMIFILTWITNIYFQNLNQNLN